MMESQQSEAPEVPDAPDTAAESTTRAHSIARWAFVLVMGLAVGIAAVTLRVMQLKLSPDPRLVAAMQDENGRLAQQRQVWDGLPRGEIVDRNGRTLALDALSGTLYIDVRDLYRDTIRSNEDAARRMKAGKAKEHDRIVLDPISELAAQLGPMLNVAPDTVVHRIVDRDPAKADHERVPAALRQLPASGTLTEAEWSQLPRYVAIEKKLEAEQIDRLRRAKEEGGPTSIVRAAHFSPQSERVRPYGDTGAALVGKTGIDVVDNASLVVDLRSLYRDATEYNRHALEAMRNGESPALISDPIGELAAAVAPLAGLEPRDVLVSVLGEAGLDPKFRVDAWARTMQPESELGEDDLEALPTKLVLKQHTTAGQRDRIAKAQESDQAQPALAYVSVLTGTEGIVGRSGVERLENGRLSSKPGYTTYYASRLGSVITIPPEGYREGDAGEPVRLAIDIVMQELVEARVDEAVKSANAAGGRALVVDASTGEILAAYSTINPNTGRTPITTDFGQGDPALARMRWATDPFEPGSIFKPFVWAWAIDHNFVDRGDRIPLPDGPLVISDGRAKRTIREAHDSSYGTKSWEQVLVKSVNAGMATIALRMGNDEMKRCLATWQFGRSTEVGVENESRGLLPPSAEWTNKTRALASVSFGQGIAVTPLQLVRAFSAFCRNGDMVPLSLRPTSSNALTGSMPVLSTAAVRESREVMEKVITEGTGKRLKEMLLYRAFGKSGTAQLTRPEGGYYPTGEKRNMSSFIAGAPFDNPEIVVLVTIEDPDPKAKASGGATGGGSVAGPVAGHIINDVLGYMGVPPDAQGELVYDEKKDDAKKKLAGR